MKTYIVYTTDKLSIAITAEEFEKREDSIAFYKYDATTGIHERIALFNLNNIIGVTEG